MQGKLFGSEGFTALWEVRGSILLDLAVCVVIYTCAEWVPDTENLDLAAFSTHFAQM